MLVLHGSFFFTASISIQTAWACSISFNLAFSCCPDFSYVGLLIGLISSMSPLVEKSSLLTFYLMDKHYVAWQCPAEVGCQVLSCATEKTMNMGTEGIKAAFSFGRRILKINRVQENSICVRELVVWDSQNNLSPLFCLFFCCPY